ncbi:MAG: orotidine-5'-phosphate decarboxylase [Candidatus Levybacteria bacterium]|nr:orotidine-5'-phosphate decarboxylase [Candidatus Levybacteria bacterium]
MNFQQKLNNIIKNNNSLVCIGLDVDIKKLPKHLLQGKDPIFEFNKAIIDKTHDLVCCYKANIAYYSSQGTKGLETLIKTIEYIHHRYTGIPVILDAKRADIGSTSEQYGKEVFEIINADAVTVSPYLGFDAVEPFLKYKDRGIIILCRTSNKGASDFQDLLIDEEPLYIKVAKKIVEWDKKYDNCLMVVGATWPNEMKRIREIAPKMFFLVPGIGTQGGDMENTLKNGLTQEKSGQTPIKSGLIIHSARSIIYASSGEDFREKAREKAIEMRDEINKYR